MNTKSFFKISLFILMSFHWSVSAAADTALNASVVPDRATVGQPLVYTVTISGIEPSALNITLPEKKIVYPETNKKSEKKRGKNDGNDEKSSGEFVPLYIINGASRDDSGSKNGEIVIKINLGYYRTGTYQLPEIKISGSDGIVIGYKIPSVTIEETNREGTLEEIEPPVSLAGNYTRIILVAAALVIAAAAAFMLFRYLEKRRKTAAYEDPTLPPFEIFLMEVESLKLRELILEGRTNEYVFGISIIFRRYLSSMLQFDAAEMTTDEISANIKKFMPAELYQVFGEEIISNMRLWDFSKFAEFTPSAELLLGNLDATISAAKRISGIQANLSKEEGEHGTVRV